MRASKRVVLATAGSLGDLHPCLALGVQLRRRGYGIAVATAEWYRAKIEACGLEYQPMRPHWNLADPALVRRCADLKRGYEVLYRELLLPELPGAYTDLLAAASDADLLLAGELALAAPLAAEKLGLRWGSLILSPCSFLSTHDPSVLANAPHLHRLARVGRGVYWTALQAGRLATRHWWRPVAELRRQEGLRLPADPIFRDKFSPELNLALFSHAFAEPQPDWPPAGVCEEGRHHSGAGAREWKHSGSLRRGRAGTRHVECRRAPWIAGSISALMEGGAAFAS